MRVNEATDLAKKYVREALPDVAAAAMQLDAFAYDDHLAVWTVTLAVADAPNGRQVVRISNADGSLLSIRDR
jgi:hypothetical protein